MSDPVFLNVEDVLLIHEEQLPRLPAKLSYLANALDEDRRELQE